MKCIYCGEAMAFQLGDDQDLLVEPCGCEQSTKAKPADWQPISTAPKDGTRILVWVKSSPPHVADVAWKQDVWRETGRDYSGWLPGAVTKWMPLNIPACPRCEGAKVVGVCKGEHAGTWQPCPTCAAKEGKS